MLQARTANAWFTRASVATDVDAAGVLSSFAVDALRSPAALGALIEDARTNGIRNPRADGPALLSIAPISGFGSAPATHWSVVNHASGLTLDTSPITANGMSGVRLRYYGTTTASPGGETVEFESRTAIAAAVGQVWSGSKYYRLAAGTLPTGTFVGHRVLTLTAAAAIVDNVNSAALVLDGTLRRAALTITAGTNAAQVVNALNMTGFPASTACDFTVDVFGPQLELGASASSLILPPVGTPAATTRARDVFAIAGSDFTDLFGAGGTRGCVYADVQMPAVYSAPSSGRVALMIDDGTAANRAWMRVNQAGNLWIGQATAASVGGAATTIPGAPVYAVTQRVGLRWNGATVHGCVNGGAVTAIPGAGSAPCSALRLGHDLTAGALFGRIRLVRALDYAPADAEFQARCTVGAA